MEHDLVTQILGGLQLELLNRFPAHYIKLNNESLDSWYHHIIFNKWTIVVDGNKIKIVIIATRAESPTKCRSRFRRVLFEYDFVAPGSDFEPIFEFIDKELNITDD